MRFTVLTAILLTATACAPNTSNEPATNVAKPAHAEPQAKQADDGIDAAAKVAVADAGGEVDAAPERTTAELAMDPTVELPAEVRAALTAVEYDPNPEGLVRDSHYWVSNENFHHLYKKHIEGNGGIFAGVGTDQNYMLAAWARSPIIVMLDFDEEIRNVHHIYGAIFRRAETADEMRDAWRSPEEVEAWLRADFEGDRADQLIRTYDISRGFIYARLRKVAKMYTEREVTTFLTDPEQYAYIRDLWRRGRVIAVRGDLTGDAAMLQLARALDAHGLKLGLLYTSNAEQYFPFTPEYRRNIIAMPVSSESLVLRTRPYTGLGLPEEFIGDEEEEEKWRKGELEPDAGAELTREGEYHYNVQPLANFQQWLKVSQTPDVLKMMLRGKTNDPEIDGLSKISRDPKVSRTPPEVAPMPESE